MRLWDLSVYLSPAKGDNWVVPIFDYRCPLCTTESRDVLVVKDEDVPSCRTPECPLSDRPMTKVFLSAAKVHDFKEGWYEHIDSQPIYISSKKQLREETEKRGQYSEYARD